MSPRFLRDSRAVPEYAYDLGTYGRPISTSSADAQAWFDRGLVWSYGFNHEEAVRCFERAAEADPACAMAHWGVAYAIGPNYNKAWDRVRAATSWRRRSRPHRRRRRAGAVRWRRRHARSSGR